jgi:ankyrin repeat protein
MLRTALVATGPAGWNRNQRTAPFATDLGLIPPNPLQTPTHIYTPKYQSWHSLKAIEFEIMYNDRYLDMTPLEMIEYPLHGAALRATLPEFITILADNPNALYTLGPFRMTPVDMAMRRIDENFEIMRFICDQYSQSVSFSEQEVLAPLMYAATHLSAEAVYTIAKLCQEAMSTLFCVTGTSIYTAFLTPVLAMMARYSWKEDRIKYIIDNYREAIKVPSSNNITPLHCIAAKGGMTTIFKTVVAIWPEALEMVCDHTYYVAECEVVGNPVHTALIHNKCDGIINFITRCYKSALLIRDHEGRLAIHYAAEVGSFSVFKMIFDACPHTAEMHPTNGNTIAHRARHSKTYKYIYEKSPALFTMANNSGELPLHMASREGPLGEFKQIYYFFPGGVFIRTAGGYVSDMDTPAHYATYRQDGNADIILFISSTCPRALAIPNKNGALPLHLMLDELSSFRVNLSAIRSVHFAYPAAIKTKDNRGNLPLHYLLATTDLDDDRQINTVPTEDATSKFADCLRFLLREYPDAANCIRYAYSTNNWAEYVKRIILRVSPSLSPMGYRRLNWQHRRLFMMLSYGPVVMRPDKDFILKLRSLASNGPFDMMMEIVSYL